MAEQSAQPRVAILFTGELRMMQHKQWASRVVRALAVFPRDSIFVSTWREHSCLAPQLAPQRNIRYCERGEEVDVPQTLWQWYHLHKLLTEFAALLQPFSHLAKLRTDLAFFEPLSLQPFEAAEKGALYLRGDLTFYGMREIFLSTFSDFYTTARMSYVGTRNATATKYVPIDLWNLVRQDPGLLQGGRARGMPPGFGAERDVRKKYLSFWVGADDEESDGASGTSSLPWFRRNVSYLTWDRSTFRDGVAVAPHQKFPCSLVRPGMPTVDMRRLINDVQQLMRHRPHLRFDGENEKICGPDYSFVDREGKHTWRWANVTRFNSEHWLAVHVLNRGAIVKPYALPILAAGGDRGLSHFKCGS